MLVHDFVMEIGRNCIKSVWILVEFNGFGDGFYGFSCKLMALIMNSCGFPHDFMDLVMDYCGFAYDFMIW